MGKGGGYRLARAPEACLSCVSERCEKADACQTLPMWEKYYEMTKDYFTSIRLSDLL